ncbi:MAG: NADP-dependent malic enzyme [Flavobacteriales bacterium]|jgi:malate dehydrogenase (oxaloacetate-decarboxylating)(NADP+)|nr:NADP-dependent malic enzyme [Flavobacteriales bacterium]MBT3962749.1 NADP-dependent malic enzyme [Flavobacteriales bacterium]MBT4705900.1 NADP-dependent malic enzyme [Flavobacteriales bacterium]MBT4929568.1 NADP-dependent malic enzyme [Flavobacteriales bacterium]MBT5131686.1 NADP-dependent malic enzyme [Flavobacteriales bacterium]
MVKIKKQEALDYHSSFRPGKIEVIPSKPYSSQRDLSLAYSPGVAEPCLRIAEDPNEAYKYTTKGNLVAVISNGTAVLGLGNIGPEASKPVMEGKGLLFKIFADIDVFDIEINETNVDKFIETVKAISPTFGGINLEDIKSPEAFEIEERLKEELNIPIMHDDQHGTAIISCAALTNALEIAEKKIEGVKVVVSGAGAAAISCISLYKTLGVKSENVIMVDSKGVINDRRKDLDELKKRFSADTPHNTLAEAMVGADVFLGLSSGGVVSQEMVKSMAVNPIVFACANPDPEISYHDAMAARDDVIMATGRSDFPNQVNNVLGFPYIFRGALDVRATGINEEMKLAAVHALSNLAKENVPIEVTIAYGETNIAFGRDYIIPKPLDYRLITHVAPAVAKAAIESGVAREPITDWDAYSEELDKRLGLDNKLLQSITERARRHPKRVVFAEADHYKILKAAQTARDDGVAIPILLGKKDRIKNLIEEYGLDFENVEIIDPRSRSEEERRKEFAKVLFEKRKRRGYTFYEAKKIMRERNYFGAAMVESGEADVMISGLTRNYPDTVKPALQVIGTDPEVNKIAGMYVIITKNGPLFLADATVNYSPTAEGLAEITVLVAKAVERFRLKPRIAMLSYSNFGSSDSAEAIKVRDAVSILHRDHPELVVDGEVQANFAMNKTRMKEMFPFSKLSGKEANVLIFPNLSAGNIAYKMIQEMDVGETIGPILLGMNKPVHILQLGSSVREIVNMVTIAVADAQTR